jgi:hypothetical protein
MTDAMSLIIEYWNDLPEGIVIDERITNPDKDNLIPEESLRVASPEEQIMYAIWFITSAYHLGNKEYLQMLVAEIEKNLDEFSSGKQLFTKHKAYINLLTRLVKAAEIRATNGTFASLNLKVTKLIKQS